MSHRMKPFPVEVTNRKNLLHKEPSVINEKMIRESLRKLLPKGEEGKHARQAGINPRKAKHLLIEFQSISQIANLSHMIKLTKLQLCNNVITKIERLDELVSLVHLDLSFNSIAKIQGLEKLRNLTFINFHRNLITTLENMENQLKLEIFIISTNGLDNLENIKYLRRFVRLSAVNLDGNPVCDDFNFRPFVIAFLPDLFILDYYHVPSQEKAKAISLYKARVEKLIAFEDKARRRASVVEAEEAVQEVYKKAFIEGFEEDEFWRTLYENDTNGKIILSIQDIDDVQLTYHELFRRASRELFQKGMKAYGLRENEYEAFNQAVNEVKDGVKEMARGIIEDFTNWSRLAIRDLRAANVRLEEYERRYETTNLKKLPDEYRQTGDKLNEDVLAFLRRLHQVWYTVMTAEIELNEQIIEVGSELDRSIRELVTAWLEQLRSHFSSIRDVQLQYHERIVETLVTYGDYRVSDTDIPENLRALVTDKEALGAVIQASHEHHSAIIDQKEEGMVSSLKKWLDSAMIAIRTNEIIRSRMRIAEVSHFVDRQRGYLDELNIISHVTCYIPDVRGDQDHIPTPEEMAQNKRNRHKSLKSQVLGSK